MEFIQIQIIFIYQKQLCIKGTLVADTGNIKKSLKIFNNTIEASPIDPIAYFNHTTVKVHMGLTEGARNDFFNFDKIKN